MTLVPMEMSVDRPEVRFGLQGESGLVVDFGDLIDETVNTRLRTFAALLAEAELQGVLELVPTYRSLLVRFDPLLIERQALTKALSELLPATGSFEGCVQRRAKVIHVPVCYGGPFGPDLQYVADHCGLTAGDVIAIHSAPLYLVYMLGFTPGFPYLGGMSGRIATPRLEVPRTEIPAGSVGIAGGQTGIYPVVSPGGWRLIGRTPLRLFDPGGARPFLFDAGDRVRFFSISDDGYEDLHRRIGEGTYEPLVETTVMAGDDA